MDKSEIRRICKGLFFRWVRVNRMSQRIKVQRKQYSLIALTTTIPQQYRSTFKHSLKLLLEYRLQKAVDNGMHGNMAEEHSEARKCVYR